ncbi:unnamed protein product [Rotaria sp. Silwood1]|nr:unnamed protein product [Rotaria sp. Silwood1]
MRYRLGDVVTCTRLLSQHNDTVPIPSEQIKLTRIPLISVAYRAGNLLNVGGENTTEQHLLDALRQTVQIWKQQNIDVDICDFTLYPQLDMFPTRYVMFLELIDPNSHHENKAINRQHPILQNKDALSEIERQLCQSNHIYRDHRNAEKLGSFRSILRFWMAIRNRDCARKPTTTSSVASVSVAVANGIKSYSDQALVNFELQLDRFSDRITLAYLFPIKPYTSYDLILGLP